MKRFVRYRGGLPPSKLRLVTDFIESHIQEKVSLRRMAEQARMSPYHFGHLFKQSTGFPPHQYLLERRILRAKELLADEVLTIKEISQRVGFGSTSHFTTTFRKRVGITPREYRLRDAKTTDPISPTALLLLGGSLLGN